MTRSRPGPGQPAATIQDVARLAGVGPQTVSNVLNGSGRVGEATRARVLEAVTALGYSPNHGARSLRSRRTRQLAYVIPPIQLRPDNYIMQQFLQALAAAAGRRGHGVVVIAPDGDPREEMRRLMASRSVDGFLLSEAQPDDPRVALLAEAGMPFACFGYLGPGLPQHWVDIDNRAAVVEAVRHVRARGYRRLAFVGYRTADHWDLERASGFRAGLARPGETGREKTGRQKAGRGDTGRGDDGARVVLVDEAGARQEIESLLARDGTGPAARPDAVVTGSDRLAAVTYGVAAELGLRIGRDLGVTGFDGSAAAGLLHPRLTSAAIPVEEIARRVVARVLRQLDAGEDQAPGEVVPAVLRLGASTSGPPGEKA